MFRIWFIVTRSFCCWLNGTWYTYRHFKIHFYTLHTVLWITNVCGDFESNVSWHKIVNYLRIIWNLSTQLTITSNKHFGDYNPDRTWKRQSYNSSVRPVYYLHDYRLGHRICSIYLYLFEMKIFLSSKGFLPVSANFKLFFSILRSSY